MKRNREFCTAPFLLSALAVAFCAWTALGNDINLCVTAGCQLYQSVSLAGISLWWIGCGVFTILGILAIAGLANLGCLFSGLALAGDIGLLLLMALTAPCVPCLVAALFFALIYFFYQLAVANAQNNSSMMRKSNASGKRSILLLVWLVFFVVNLGAVVRSQMDLWPILDTDDQAGVRMFFSPSCPSCQKGVAALSGRVDVAFYPLAENDSDVYKVAAMQGLLDAGMSMADALREAQNAEPPAGIGQWMDQVFLRWRLLRNKAHIFSSGAQTVPFFEYMGLPRSLDVQAGRVAGHPSGMMQTRTDQADTASAHQNDQNVQGADDSGSNRSGAGESGQGDVKTGEARPGEARMRLAFPGDHSLPFDDPSVPLVSGRCGENSRCLPAPEKKPVQRPAYGQRQPRTRTYQTNENSANQPSSSFPVAE